MLTAKALSISTCGDLVLHQQLAFSTVLTGESDHSYKGCWAGRNLWLPETQHPNCIMLKPYRCFRGFESEWHDPFMQHGRADFPCSCLMHHVQCSALHYPMIESFGAARKC